MQSFHVKCFLTIAKCKKFSAASEELCLSQPSLSRQIHSLEEELGFKLFNRNHWGVELTEEGRIMYDYFSRAEEEYEYSLRQATNLRKNNFHLTVGILDGLDPTEFARPFYNLQQQSDEMNLDISFIQLPYDDLIRHLSTGQADMIVAVMYSRLFSESFDSLKILPAELKVVDVVKNGIYYSVNQKLIRDNPAPTISDFRDCVFFQPAYINGSDSSRLQKVVQNYYEEVLGFKPNTIQIGSFMNIYLNVESGKGVALCAEHNLLDNSPLIRRLELDEESYICYIWKQGNLNTVLKEWIQTTLKSH